MKEVIRNKIIHASYKNIDELRVDLLSFKKLGGTQKEAYRYLEELKLEFKGKENEEDVILELLDYVVGWCRPDLSIWE